MDVIKSIKNKDFVFIAKQMDWPNTTAKISKEDFLKDPHKYFNLNLPNKEIIDKDFIQAGWKGCGLFQGEFWVDSKMRLYLPNSKYTNSMIKKTEDEYQLLMKKKYSLNSKYKDYNFYKSCNSKKNGVYVIWQKDNSFLISNNSLFFEAIKMNGGSMNIDRFNFIIDKQIFILEGNEDLDQFEINRTKGEISRLDLDADYESEFLDNCKIVDNSIL